MEHARWCDRDDHDERSATARQNHPASPEWTGCAGTPQHLDLDGIRLSGNLLEPEPGRTCAVFEASRDGRLLPASFCLDVADAAQACAWAAGIISEALPQPVNA